MTTTKHFAILVALSLCSNVLTAQTTFGRGCGPVATWPRLALTAGAPQIGNSFNITGSLLNPNNRSITAVGLSNTSWAGVPLPLTIDDRVFPACQLLVAGHVLLSGQTTGNGEQTHTFSVPNNQALVGVVIYFQMATPARFTSFTEGLEVRIRR